MFLNNFLYWTEPRAREPELPWIPQEDRHVPLSPDGIQGGSPGFCGWVLRGSWGIEQTSVQFLTNVLDYGMNIQAAIEAPRVRMTDAGRKVMMEGRIPKEVRDGLQQKGHVIDLLEDFAIVVGGAHGITVDEGGKALMGGADPRRDGYVLGI